MIVWILLIVLGFVFLVKGADLLVEGASNFAKKFHIPEIIIGLTIVSIGTSLPELFVSITSAIDGYPDMAIGNVVGSNIANMFLILGMSAIIKTITFKKETRLIEIPICLAVSIIFMILCNIGQDITRIDAIILTILFIAFIAYTIVMAKKGEEFDKEENEEDIKKEDKPTGSVIKNIIYMILGIVLLKFGGDFTVDNAVNIANFFGLSEKLISVTILAVGTSLPELVTSVSAAIKGKSDIAIGNIIGSNIFNILFIIGVSALIKPIVYNMSYNIDMIFVLLSTIILALFPIIPPKNKMSRWNGIVYVILYIVYIVTLLIK
ncbi:MAG: calcium/sodium antiporter [Clostridiales bacterium]|nr:calcium/sodium antiporter [Clostridiales bacterium]